jgi:hypothetical protein
MHVAMFCPVPRSCFSVDGDRSIHRPPGEDLLNAVWSNTVRSARRRGEPPSLCHLRHRRGELVNELGTFALEMTDQNKVTEEPGLSERVRVYPSD